MNEKALDKALKDSEISDILLQALKVRQKDPMEFLMLEGKMDELIYDRIHPDIEHFLFDRDWLGIPPSEVRPNVLRAFNLITTAEEVTIVKMLLGSGSGKSYIVSHLLAYKTHEFLSHVNPQAYYGLATGSPVAILNLSTNAGQALNVIFKTFSGLIESIPTFENLEKKYKLRRGGKSEPYQPPPDSDDPNKLPEKYRSARAEIEFPEKHLLCISGHSKAASFYGYSVFTGTIDEADHIERETRPKKKTRVEQETTYTEELYAGLKKAIFSRFGKRGLLFLISTSLAKTAFLSRRVFMDRGIGEEIDIDDGHIFIEHEQRKPNTPECYYTPSIESPGHELTIIAPTWVMTDEPRDLYIRNENDVKAKRDYGCEPPDAASGALPKPDIVTLQSNKDRVNPWDEENCVIDFTNLPIDKSASYYFHWDLSLTGDNVGLCLLHRDHETGRYIVDMFGNVITSAQRPFDMNTPIRVVLTLKNSGMHLAMVTFDGWQSVKLVQDLLALGIPASQMSADKNKGPYDTLITMLIQDMLDYPHHEQFETEMRYLEDMGDKYDHPAKFVTNELGCFTGDTKVKLLDGRHLSFEELYKEFCDGKEFYVYSIGEHNSVTVGRARNPRVTKTVTRLVEVELDNGEKIRSTPDHLYMLRDGHYRAAEDLLPGLSLMPMYAEIKDMDSMSGYEVFYDPGCGHEQLTHRMVGAFLYSDLGYTGERGGAGVIHHKDLNKTNNDPQNLEWCKTQIEHVLKYHPDQIMKNRAIPEVEARRIENWNKYYDEEGGREKQAEVMRTNFNNHKEKIIEAIRQTGKKTGKQNITNYNKSEEHRKVASEIGKRTIWLILEKNMRKDVTPEIIAEKMREGYLLKEIAIMLKCSIRTVSLRRKEAIQKGLLPPLKKNHKVASVRIIDCEPTPVYDITVDEHHNFALSAGVFVHNSKDVSDATACSLYNCINALSGLLISQQEMLAATEHIFNVNSMAKNTAGEEIPFCEIDDNWNMVWNFPSKVPPMFGRSAYIDTVNEQVLLFIGYKRAQAFVVDFIEDYSGLDPDMPRTALANIVGMKCEFVSAAPTAPYPLIEMIRGVGVRVMTPDMAFTEMKREKHMRPVRAIRYPQIELMIQAIKGGILRFCENDRLVRELYELTQTNYEAMPYACALAGWYHYMQQNQRKGMPAAMPKSLLNANLQQQHVGGNMKPVATPSRMPRSVMRRK